MDEGGGDFSMKGLGNMIWMKAHVFLGLELDIVRNRFVVYPTEFKTPENLRNTNFWDFGNSSGKDLNFWS